MTRQTDDIAAVLAANQVFYAAFAARDFAAMEAIWARAHPVACVHPGWPALLERATVVESWRRILANPGAPKIRCFRERALLYQNLALVICYEILEQGTLVATNTFVREEGGWRISHHQSSPVSNEAMAEEEASPPLKN